MPVKDYLNKILNTISTNPFLKSQSISFEERPPDAAYIKGIVIFIDDSKLYFKEFVIFKPETFHILKYGYNYTAKDNVMIFRYDNALDPKCRNFSTYPEHKHSSEGIFPAKRPSFEDLLNEISEMIAVDID